MSTAYESAVALDAAYHMQTYARRPVMFVRGRGAWLYDDAGREYLDCVAGIGAVNLGHAHPAVAEAVCEQMRKLVHVSNLYYVEHRARLAEIVVGLAGGDRRVFFCNSGAEASEGAIKLARKWARRERGPDCAEIITAERSFHGRTLAALAATGQASKQEAFEPLPPGFSHVPLNDIDALAAAVTDRTCAIMLEPVQGEGGVFPCRDEYLRAVRALCDERGVLLILDEVQTGFFRTGPAFAFHSYGAEPDIMTLAKSMANGLPIGAVVARSDVASAFEPGDHGSTFGGGPVICAAAIATIETMIAERVCESAVRVGAYLERGLRDLAERSGGIAEVRSRGLMLAVTLAEPRAAAVASAALAAGVVINTIGDSILRFLPPLVCTTEETDILLDTLKSALEAS